MLVWSVLFPCQLYPLVAPNGRRQMLPLMKLLLNAHVYQIRHLVSLPLLHLSTMLISTPICKILNIGTRAQMVSRRHHLLKLRYLQPKHNVRLFILSLFIGQSQYQLTQQLLSFNIRSIWLWDPRQPHPLKAPHESQQPTKERARRFLTPQI